MKIASALFFTLIILTLAASAFSGISDTNGTIRHESDSDADSESLIYELCTYKSYNGKLDKLHTRFENHTMDLFEKHGMTNIMYWSPRDTGLSDNT